MTIFGRIDARLSIRVSIVAGAENAPTVLRIGPEYPPLYLGDDGADTLEAARSTASQDLELVGLAEETAAKLAVFSDPRVPEALRCLRRDLLRAADHVARIARAKGIDLDEEPPSA
jgi:hypothetical protein